MDLDLLRRATTRILLLRVVVAVLMLCGLGAAWAGLTRFGPSADRMRASLYEDVDHGRLDRCEHSLAWLAKHDRLTAHDLLARARVCHARGRLDEALGSLKEIRDGDDLAAPARLQAARIELSEYRTRDAETSLTAALARDPRLASARLELIRLYARQQRLEELDFQFQSLASQGVLDLAYLSFWGMTRNLHWEPESDVEALRRAVEADPEDRASRLALAEGLRRLGRGAEAAPLLVPLPADDADARAVRAALALDRSDLDEASGLIAEGPEMHAETARLRGLLALSRHDHATAATHFRTALAIKPDDRRTLSSLGTALKLTGQDAEAARYFAEVRRFDLLSALTARLTETAALSDASLLRRLGIANEEVGRLIEAREWYRLAIAQNPLDSESQRALFRLEARAARAGPGGTGQEP
ncbi:MAG: tetratricopeptide repeat protein [Paludisphaera borealis]|uniref:tetratricopeptide repeat protein n=1 Tax=Paludisphaera borealis TaxID=1387353 RepID=UPI002847143C|nr:tetratricopeptide repeat protein [Paludisphaera borealis]MDR3623180.1 tetratricopeptide repeat protein [Paludisphaera borealis]